MNAALSSGSDRDWLTLALALAQRVGMDTAPNPKVGCVLVRDGQVLGQGFTQPLGQAHAEVQALRAAVAAGHTLVGATAYVTLEPCSHYGRTPPCANALIEAGIVRVVAALQDANPQVAGQGRAMLLDAGVAFDWADQLGLADLALAARELNIGFFCRMESGLPWVRMKVAASVDGKTALPNGQSQWITGPQARRDGHLWRARADVILTGSGTVLADDPQLTVRDAGAVCQPLRVVLDSALRVPPTARIFDEGAVLLVCAAIDVERSAALQARGAEILCLPAADGRVDLLALIAELGRRQINEVHVEAGAVLNGALIAADCVDELLLYLAPKLLGAGAGLFHLPLIEHVDAAQQLVFQDTLLLGADVRLRARFKPGV
ncbi:MULTISPECIES: bifunctional diaminohydroxyphosphoribosylaminopyrimidine deaminase/5-amino-6-(5-phosphoribosylamino)uracil reductase RibD [unclassified Undibacterium]|uniref:bifunctional diaminohydroxyphosphoribosylaminopyrimidine deaminase/5-amino-6-(5-phosphoribosylamino)uracil reductase RibD n=1 Tax=unclassified Undibacterium TaxID=2630295 RepID=UPI002AC985B5|nr:MULTISPECIES: bifunctional diaminohydroxyphosphoribosylaminopyrimidine deaminase/5-amino-6-(5-phosphoribosylamino)uracil reductase RibD [unclassified Undibacterium]MEB0141000.1 bifunctional diaminohydroxyphosphoribosylaminopyrimidine deaminase/5-amino-6-(5-phosphoribosylamino)uracil reductase RibD [Undibacterium sp. CCC2.1]MEB0173994.1 bifunctional diaminohydroxyphosphoribosylaminopyrimidine deaminase/5-amino-6-(5-phosphoribosylamino)uracil reductase RibD [Undibacterium sp. CCC1.1]MEB0177916.